MITAETTTIAKNALKWTKSLRDWYKLDTAKKLANVLAEMITNGMDEEIAKDLIESVISAISHEYGD